MSRIKFYLLIFSVFFTTLAHSQPLSPDALNEITPGAITANEITGDEITVTDLNDQDYTVTIYPVDPAVDKKLTLIWLEELDKERPAFEAVMKDLQDFGITIWRVDLLESLFLERSGSNVRGLNGQGVKALVDAAAVHTDQPFMVVAVERMALAALRGVRLWQAQGIAEPHFSGVSLLYPNLFQAAPVAGEDPTLFPIASSVSFPVFVFQPEKGALRYRLTEQVSALQTSGGQIFVRQIPNVRDWFIMNPREESPAIARAVADLPAWLKRAAILMNRSGAGDIDATQQQQARKTLVPIKSQRVRGLVQLNTPYLPAPFRLLSSSGEYRDLQQTSGKVTIVNYWASWCPPCVEEIPSMNRLLSRYTDQDFELISINFKEEPGHIENFMRKVKVDFPVLLDPEGHTAKDWKVFAFPTSFLLDKTGKVRYSVNSAINWDSPEIFATVNALLAE